MCFVSCILNFQGPFERLEKYPSLVREREGQKNNPKSAFFEKFLKDIGVEEDVEADSFAVPLEEEKEQYFLLCSDGLSNLLEERDLYKIVLQPKELLSIEKKVDCLIELANERGGNDNITAYLIDSKG